MKKSRYTEEQIVGVLKESEAGLETAELCRKHGDANPGFGASPQGASAESGLAETRGDVQGTGNTPEAISQQTFYRWKAKYGGLEVSEAQRLRHLEEEKRKLKELGAAPTRPNQTWTMAFTASSARSA